MALKLPLTKLGLRRGSSNSGTASSGIPRSHRISKGGKMERVQVGMHVEIRRSDGRVHGAVVADIIREKNAVLVEWFEKNETKGKEVNLEELLAINPMLVGKSALSDIISQSMSQPPAPAPAPASKKLELTFLDLDEDIENESLFVPPPAASKAKRTSFMPPPRNGLDSTLVDPPKHKEIANGVSTRTQPPTTTAAEHRHTVLIKSGSSKNLTDAIDELPQVQTTTQRSRISGMRMPSQLPPPMQTKLPARPVRQSVAVAAQDGMSRSTDTIEDGDSGSGQFDRKGATVQEIERLQKQRDERRAQQEKVKKAKEAEKMIDPGNPNYQFLMMIREYQNQIDYRPLKMSDAVCDSRISVCVRKRPMSRKENTKKEIEVVTIPNRDHLIVHQPQQKVDLTKYLENLKFRFDYAFDENVNNEMVYRFTAQPLVRTIFEQGFATCFAYGQTGSGKTHTMGGDFSGKAQDCAKGIYALAAADVFRLQRGEYRSMGLQVACSFFEIYGGKVFDLLKDKALLRVLEDGKKEVQVVGLQEEVVTSEQQVLDLIKKGTDVRTAGTTSANANSSRSHAVFQIILKKNKKLWGKFSLIDLAGNERGQDTGSADRQTRMEGAEINKSLLALKECIRAMGKNSNHVPFRQSKLTMVLRDSFMGEKARTCMIAMIGPAMGSCEHTVNTLRYADRVKELGADEAGGTSPMKDEDFMLAGGEEDIDMVLQSNGNSKSDVKLEKVMQVMTQLEEKVINDQYACAEEAQQEVKDLTKLLHRINDPDYDMEEYAKEWVKQLEQQMADRRAMLDNAHKWIKVIQQEADLSAKAKRGK